MFEVSYNSFGISYAVCFRCFRTLKWMPVGMFMRIYAVIIVLCKFLSILEIQGTTQKRLHFLDSTNLVCFPTLDSIHRKREILDVIIFNF